MSWRAVAQKDFRDSIRSRRLIVFVGSFMAVLGLLVFAIVWFEPAAISSALTPRQYTGTVIVLLGGFLEFLPSPLAQLLPFIGLLVGYKSVISERETGQLKFLLGLPNSRFDVMFGKLVGRSLVGLVAAIISFVLAALLILVFGGGGLAIIPFVLFALITGLFVVTHVAIGLGISAIVTSNRQATGLFVLFVGIFQILWTPLFIGLRVLVFEGTLPKWALFIQSLSPVNAYKNALRAFVIQPLSGALSGVGGGVFNDLLQQSAPAFYLADWVGMLVLLVWIVGTFALGYAVFRRADVG